MNRRKNAILAALFLTSSLLSFGQCALYDYNGDPSNSPVWYSCSGGDFTLNIQSPNNLGAWSIDWGDGSPIETGPSLVFPDAISHLYPAAVDIYTITFTETGTGCTTTGILYQEEATSASIQIPVGGLTQACAPQEMEFTNSSTNVSTTTTFTWDFGDGSPNEVYDHTNWNQTIPHTYEKNTVDCETVVTLTAENQCNIIQGGSSTATFNPIRIWDVDDASINADPAVLCFPDNTVTLTNTTDRNCVVQGNIAQRYEYWNFGDYWGLGHDSIIDWTPWPPTVPRVMSYPGIGDYQVMLLDSNFCGIDTAYTTISIVPPPTADLTSDEDTICQGESITFFNGSSAESNAWLIDFDEGAGWQATNGTQTTHTFNTAGNYHVGLVAYVSGAGAACTDTSWVDITVQPGPQAGILLGDSDGCGTLTTSVDDNSTNAVSWDWNMGNGNTYTIESPPDQTYNSPGNYTITLTVEGANSCTDNASATAHVHHIPEASFTTSAVCLGDTAYFIDGSTVGGGAPIVTWAWDFDDTGTSVLPDPEHYYASGGSYDVTLTVSTPFCSDDTIVTLDIDTPPTAGFDMDIDAGCSPLTVDLTNTSIDGSTYTWLFGDGAASTDTNTVHTFINTSVNDTVYNVSLIARNTFGCTDTIVQPVTVASQTTAAFTSDASPGCAPFTANFFNSSINASGYIWDFGDGSPTSTDVNPSHFFENTTPLIQNYEVVLVALNPAGCNDTISQTVTAYPEPDFAFDLSSYDGCAPLTVQFPIIPNAVTYQWDFGDGNTATGPTPTNIFQNTGTTTATYTVRLIASNAFGCVDTSYSDIDVYPMPISQFTSDVTEGCSPLTVEFENLSLLSVENEWIYSAGDTLIENAILHEHTFINTTPNTISFNVRLNVTSADGCVATSTGPITVHPEVTAAFESDTAGCAPLAIDYVNTSVGASDYQWQFGDGLSGIQSDPSHTFFNNSLNDTTFTSRLVAISTHGCTDTAYTGIDVYHLPQTDFDLSDFQGCTPLEVTFTNNTTGATDYLWTYGDGDTSDTTAAVHAHTYVNTSPDTWQTDVTLTATSDKGCADTESATLTIFPEILAAFESDTIGCSPLEIAFTDHSIGADQYEWDFGDGWPDYQPEPTHIYYNNSLNDTVYSTRLIVSSIYGCVDTAYSDIHVHHNPVVNMALSDVQGCTPLNVTLTNGTTGADSFLWDYGDGETSDNTAIEHDHLYINSSGVVWETEVKLIAMTDMGCIDSDSISLTVYPEIRAAFESDTIGCSPLEIAFTDNSIGTDVYQWNFGDGWPSSDAEPTHVFTNNTLSDTIYTTRLIVGSIYGCADTAYADIHVNHNPTIDLQISAMEGCTPLDVTFINNSEGADDFLWEYGDGQTGDTTSALHEHTYISTETGPWDVDMTLTAMTDKGCNASAGESITVFPAVTADFETDSALCSGEEFIFFNQSIGADQFDWTFGDGGISGASDPDHEYDNETGADLFYDVRLIAISAYSCMDTASQQVVVHTAPIADLFIESSSVCYPLYVEFANNSEFGDSFIWDYGDGTTSDTTALLHSHTFTNTTTNVVEYDITLTAITEHGCEDVTGTEVQVIPPLEAEFESITEGCHPLTVAFENTSENALTFDWTFEEDVENSVLEDPIYTFNNYGITDEVFTVTLVAESYFGCKDSVQVDITVFPLPDAEFVATPTVQVFPDATVDIVDVSVAGSADYLWDLGDGFTSTETTISSHTYDTWGSYELSLTIDNGHCSDQTIQVIEIQAPPPVAAFEGWEEGCAPVTVSFTNNSLYATNYLWNFGDGGTSGNEEPTYTYYAPGTYTVSLLATGPGGSEIVISEQEINVRPNANAYFTVNPPIIRTGDPVFFYNLSNSAESYEWDFGDGGISTESNPTYIYNETGTYPVTLVANNEYNCPDTFRLADAILVDVGGYVTFPNAFTPGVGGSGDGTYDPTQLNNDVFHPVFAGVEEYELQIYNRWGELLFQSNDIDRGWDGQYRSQPVQQGVYVWRAKVKFTDGKLKVLAGDLTLLR